MDKEFLNKEHSNDKFHLNIKYLNVVIFNSLSKFLTQKVK